jgi:hypothetical protein
MPVIAHQHCTIAFQRKQHGVWIPAFAGTTRRMWKYPMPHETPWQRHQRERWTRPDAHLWVRPDSARFYLPGTDLAEIFPEVARKRDAEQAAEAKAITREIEALEALRDELMEIKAELARRRREDEAKYSPSQPRVPAGNPRGGQWTDRSGGQGAGGIGSAVGADGGEGQGADLTSPMGDVELGDVSESSELGDLFRIKPSDKHTDGVQVGGDVIRVCIASGISSGKDDLGIKRYTITYDCAGGPSFKRNYIGNYPGIVRDPYR